MFSGEAEDAQERMQLLDDAGAGDGLDYWYWRGVRDAYEQAAYELLVELGDIRRPEPFVVMVIT